MKLNGGMRSGRDAIQWAAESDSNSITITVIEPDLLRMDGSGAPTILLTIAQVRDLCGELLEAAMWVEQHKYGDA